jgi:hypothetical protein
VDITGLKNRLLTLAKKRLSTAQLDAFEREVQLSFLSSSRWPQLIAALHYSQPTIAGWKPEVSDSALCTLIDDWAQKNSVALSTAMPPPALAHPQPAITAAPATPLSRFNAQDAAILAEIKRLGFDPLALPKNPDGKRGVKAAVRLALSTDKLFKGSTVFEKAWERLTARAEIVIRC